MAIRTRNRDRQPVSPREAKARRPQPARMQRTVLGVIDPQGNRVVLKAGDETPEWYTGEHDGRAQEAAAKAEAEAQLAVSHPALDTGSDPVPEGDAYQEYLDDVYAAARESGDTAPLRWPTQAALDTQERGLRDFLALHLDPDQVDELEALDADARGALALLDDDERAELLALAEAPVEPVAEPVAPNPDGEPQPDGDAHVEPEGEQVAEITEADLVLIDGSVETVLARIGGDAELAARALAAEQSKGDRARSTLTEPLARIANPEE